MKSFSSLFFLFSFLYGHAQNSISGTVMDTQNSIPLQDVAVYLPQLDKGTITDVEGFFKINDLPEGTYKIVASYIGFKTYSATVTLNKGTNSLNINLLPSAIEIEGVVVSTPFHNLQRENVMKVEQAQLADLRNKGALTLSDGITEIAGVESVTTGVGIGKPVIRGLSSNRVLVYTQGIRLENQQFGNEHGLGVNDAGIESVEVIKGPASLLYGSDALGGVIYLNPEKFEQAGETGGDVNLNYFSNTEGLSANAGIRTSGSRLKFLFRAAAASHVDYKGGDGLRVTNSRFKEYDLKTGIGYQSSTIKTEVRYNYNNSDLGIPEEIGEQTKRRSPDTPFQEIENHILSSNTDIFLKNTSLKLIFGFTANDRKEFEESSNSGPALHMDLNTFNYNLQYHLPKGKRLETIVGLQGLRQTNKNFGEEVLIPDATTTDVGILGTSHLHLEKSDMQFGLRFDYRGIHGDPNGNPDEEGFIPSLDRSFNSYNAALGYRSDLSDNIIGRINLASGFRAPNLAELTSNGVHEGTNRFEIGNPELDNEKNIQVDTALEFNNEHLEFYLNGFYNAISDYIFIEPNGEFMGTNAVFLYRQQNAYLYGGEIGLHLHPHPLDWLHVESNFETVTGKLDNDDFLPLIPANSLTNTLRVEFEKKDKFLKNSYAFITLKSVFDQNKISDFETNTPGYNLLNVGIGGSLKLFDKDAKLRITANNLLDETYISHLSRLKQDGIANIGRNVTLGLSLFL